MDEKGEKTSAEDRVAVCRGADWRREYFISFTQSFPHEDLSRCQINTVHDDNVPLLFSFPFFAPAEVEDRHNHLSHAAAES